jgi:hypothetical protein
MLHIVCTSALGIASRSDPQLRDHNENRTPVFGHRYNKNLYRNFPWMLPRKKVVEKGTTEVLHRIKWFKRRIRLEVDMMCEEHTQY